MLSGSGHAAPRRPAARPRARSAAWPTRAFWLRSAAGVVGPAGLWPVHRPTATASAARPSRQHRLHPTAQPGASAPRRVVAPPPVCPPTRSRPLCRRAVCGRPAIRARHDRRRRACSLASASRQFLALVASAGDGDVLPRETTMVPLCPRRNGSRRVRPEDHQDCGRQGEQLSRPPVARRPPHRFRFRSRRCARGLRRRRRWSEGPAGERRRVCRRAQLVARHEVARFREG